MRTAIQQYQTITGDNRYANLLASIEAKPQRRTLPALEKPVLVDAK